MCHSQVLRLGRSGSMHPALLDHCLGGKHFQDISVAGLRRIQATVQVLAAAEHFCGDRAVLHKHCSGSVGKPLAWTVAACAMQSIWQLVC